MVIMDTLKLAHFITSATNQQQCPSPDRIEFAIIGRSNVWKSSLINALCNQKNLAKTSGKPGKTQLINYYSIQDDNEHHGYLVDLPWYGYAKKSRDQRAGRADMISDYLISRPNLTHIFVLIDSRIKPQTIDLDFINWIFHEGKDFSLIYTKSDQTKSKDITENIKSMYTELSKFIYPLPDHIITSSIKKEGISLLVDIISQILKTSKQ
jgi:GTP-binding protein